MILRWSVVWQDSLLSLGFDRPAATAIDFRELAFTSETATEGLSYREAMYIVCKQALRVTVRNWETSHNVEDIARDAAELETLFSRVQPKIAAVENAKALDDRIQHYSLRINSSFALAALFRPSLSREKWLSMPIDRKEGFAARCKYHLTEALRAYVRLQSFTAAATRSWALLHNGLSSGLLLAIIGETNRNAEVRNLQGQLIDILMRVTSEESDVADSMESSRIWGPHTRALVALKALHSRGMKSQEGKDGSLEPELKTQETAGVMLPFGVIAEPQDFTNTESDVVSTLPKAGIIPNGPSLPQSEWPDIDLLDFSPDNLFDSVLWGDCTGQPG